MPITPVYPLANRQRVWRNSLRSFMVYVKTIANPIHRLDGIVAAQFQELATQLTHQRGHYITNGIGLMSPKLIANLISADNLPGMLHEIFQKLKFFVAETEAIAAEVPAGALIVQFYETA